jgi:hypothetical protein
MRIARNTLFLLSSIFFLTNPAWGSERKKWAIGLNYPGIGARYALSSNWAIEAKGQIETDITVVGLRVYRHFPPQHDRLHLFTGAEADFISFKGEESKGTGYAAELFAGGEYFFNPRLSFQCDVGPAYISLTDRDTSLSVSGLGYVINFGINLYFGDRISE